MPEHESMESITERLIAEERISRRHFGPPCRRRPASGFSGLPRSWPPAAAWRGRRRRTPARSAVATHPKGRDRAMTISRTGRLYIDRSVLKTWDKATGGKVKYIEDITTTRSSSARSARTAGRRAIGRESVALTDWMACRWVRLGYVRGDRQANVPNSELRADLANPNFRLDPGRKYTLPRQSGLRRHRLQPEEDRRQARHARSPLRPEFKGACRCSPTPATRRA